MRELNRVDVLQVSGGTNCWCVDDSTRDATTWQEPHVCHIIAVSAVGLVPPRTATYVRWLGENTRTECINKCCENCGTTNWVFGVGGSHKGNC